MNTPDTEWEKEFNKDFGVFNWNETARERHTGEILSCVREVFPCEGGYCDMDVSSIKEFISNLLTSRDTYWTKDMETKLAQAYASGVEHGMSKRDTYWKERVEEIYGHFSWCQECAEGPMCKDALAIKDNLK